MGKITPFLSLKDLHEPIQAELHECVRRVIDSGTYINGPEGAVLAEEMVRKLNLDHVVPLSNGLDAIRLILRGYMEMGKLKPGDEVILPANTYIATLLPVTEFGLKPVLAKPDFETYGIDWEEATKLISSKTRALITVHLYGTPSWNFDIARAMWENGILIIEDNAQAIGARITDRSTGREYCTGALGDAAAFSFYPTKNIGALGDAGAVATRDRKLADIIKALANYGSTERYHNDYIGYNCRMDEIQAAILRVKLRHLEEVTMKRNNLADIYLTQISQPDLTLPKKILGMVQVWHQFVVRSRRRNELRAYLSENGIATDIHYPVSLFNQKCYTGSNHLEDPGQAAHTAQLLSSEILSLPIASIREEQASRISDCINLFK